MGPRYGLGIVVWAFLTSAGMAADVLANADALYSAGKFTEAQAAYKKAAAADPGSAAAHRRLGALALLSNRLSDAETELQTALRLDPGDKRASGLLGEAYYRRDDFAGAAQLFRAAGREGHAKCLESFAGKTPYEHTPLEKPASAPFVITDPLPLVRVRVNDREDATFVIDTGAAEVVLDRAFAKQLGIPELGSATGTFAGGRQAAVGHGRLDSLALGELTVRNLPVGLMDLAPVSRAIFPEHPIQGVIGTVFFYHFLTTLDYPGHRLVLQERPTNPPTDGAVAVPFWMAGDHYMVAWGRVNDAPPVLLFVDTGLAGGGFTGAPSVLKEAHITLDESKAGEGMGGGGRVKVIPFTVERLSLGDATEHDVHGLSTGVLPVEHSLGFRVGGIISHAFFKPYALTFDFTGMRLLLKKP